MKKINTEIKNTKAANTILKENVVNRLRTIRAYQDARNDALAFNKGERRVIAISALVSIAVTTVIVHKKDIGFPVAELIDIWFMVAAAILAALFVVALFSRKKLDERVKPVKNIAIEATDVLKSYFVDFVKEQVTLEDNQDAVLGRISEFKVTTRADDKRLRERDVKLSGFCHYKESVVEQSVILTFSDDYALLTVKHSDQVVAARNTDSSPSAAAV